MIILISTLLLVKALSVTNTGELPIFLKKFGEDVQKIKSDIKEMRKKFKLAAQAESKEEVKNMQTEEEERSKKVRAAAEAVDDAIDKLQASVAQSAFFMPSYELRQAKASIEKLYELCEAQKLKLLPKKRFCFKSRARRAALRAAQGNSSCSSLLSPPSPTEAAASASAVRLRRQLDLLSSLQVIVFCPARTLSLRTHFWIAVPQGVENSESIRDKKGEHIYRAFGSVNGKDIWLRQLENCTVTLCDRLGALRIGSVKNCTFLVGPIGGSIHLEHAENCTFVVACRQIRIHHAHSCDFYLAVQSNPIIEDCDKLRFAPYRFEFECVIIYDHTPNLVVLFSRFIDCLVSDNFKRA